MTKFAHLTPHQQAAAALEAVRRAIAGSRMRQGDAEALQHAASLIEIFTAAPDANALKPEFVGPLDLFDTWATQENKTLEGRHDAD